MLLAKGYRVIHVPVSVTGMAFHCFYIKEHSENKVTKGKGNTMFLGNVDYCGIRSHEDIDSYLRGLLGIFGEIDSILVSDNDGKSGSSRFAHIVFKKKSALSAALAAPDSSYYECCKEMAKTWGNDDSIKKRKRTELIDRFRYEVEDKEEIRRDVNSYMKDFEESEELAKLDRERQLNEVDEDGFQLVKHRQKRKRVDEKRGSKQRIRGQKKQVELKNFYRFQMREQKQDVLNDLRQKFEEDKARIASMKAARKFKPF